MWGGKKSSDGFVVYAVGDIHGRVDLLEILLDTIAGDVMRTAAGLPLRIVFLGDYVDRGPDSRRVLDRLSALTADADLRFLKGNHEAAMLEFLENPGVGPQWCAFGGAETLASYGVMAPAAGADGAEWAAVSGELRAALPETHLAFLRSLSLFVETGDYFFAHAGVRPGRPLTAQSEQDLLWIREDFLGDRRRLPKVIVHGHTPESAAVWDKRRIGVDTGAYVTGVLTAARIQGPSVRFLSARR